MRKNASDTDFSELESESRKYFIPENRGIFMTTVGATVIDIIKNQTDSPMDVTYRLDAYRNFLSNN